jgi:hypothetical protein
MTTPRIASLAASIFLALATSAQGQAPVDYFPAGTLGATPANHDFVEGWFGRHLLAMGEPSLLPSPGAARRAIRFLRLPTWGHPVSIRIERTDAGMTLVRRELSGQGGYAPGTLASERTRAVSAAAWARIESRAAAAGGWSAPSITDFRGTDGEEWVIERVDGARYQVLDRWTPTQDPAGRAFVALCAALEELAR